jgi:hypothetical protein
MTESKAVLIGEAGEKDAFPADKVPKNTDPSPRELIRKGLRHCSPQRTGRQGRHPYVWEAK